MDMIRKTVAGGDGGLEFVLSDGTVDRYGDVIDPEGWKLANFRKNPIALFGHSGGFPIGTWTNLRVEGGRLVGRLVLAAKGTSARLDELISLVEQGILRAVSVGFRPLKSEPINPEKPWGAQRYLQQELLETSLVSVPANPAALAIAKSLHLSDETMSLAFGEHAETRRRDMTATGEHAAQTSPIEGHRSMKTVSQRLEEAQQKLAAKQQRHTELLSVETLDHAAIEGVVTEIETLERDVAALKRSEAVVAKAATAAAPAIARRPLGAQHKEVSGLELLVRRALVHGVALHTGASLEAVLARHYPDRDEATELAVLKAAAPLATTTTSGFVQELVQTTWAAFLDTLKGKSVYPELRARGFGVSFDAAGTAYLPQRTGSGANGSFFAEGSPIRVGRITVAAPTFTSRKMGVIIPFSREAAKRSTPDLEAVLRRAIIDDTAATLDPILLDATAGDTVRPAGLLYGLSAVASGYGGADYVAVKEDFKALLQPFIDANAADGITVIMNPKQGLAISLMDGPANNSGWFNAIRDRVTIVESTHATAGRLIALRNEDFATALGDMPQFEISNQATIHMEDTSPAEIVATGPTAAAPVRSFWQTDSAGIRMVMDISWKMARSGMVQWIDSTSY